MRAPLLVLCVLLGSLTSAQALDFGNPEATWTLDKKEIAARRGETVSFKVAAKIPKTWHIYSFKKFEPGEGPKATEMSLEPADQLKLAGTPTHRAPKVELDTGFNTNVEIFEDSVTFELPVYVAKTAPPGKLAATLKIEYEMCQDNGKCMLLNASVAFVVNVSDEPPLAGPEPTPSVSPAVTEARPAPAMIEKVQEKKLADEDSWGFLKAGALAGLAALFTPCVFPMVPITVSFFTKRKHVTRQRTIRDAGIYAVGIILTFTLIGGIFSATLKASGIQDFATNPWVNLAVASIFTVLALNLFGAFEIAVPSWILTKLDSKASKGEGVGSVLLMGLVFSLTSFTCTVPFIGTVLVLTAKGEWFKPLLGTLAFASVFSAPFFLLALFPALLKSLPKSGGWLNSVKVVMGFMELAAALKFISNADMSWGTGIFSRDLFLSIWIALSLLTAMYLLGWFKFAHDSTVENIGGMRIIVVTFFLGISFWFIAGLIGAPLGMLDAYVPPKAGEGREWIENWDQALDEAQRTNKPIFLDFTGVTCTNCRLMESKVFPDPRVKPLLEKFVRVRLYTDISSTPEIAARSRAYKKMLEERFQTVALPYYVIVTPNDEMVSNFDGYTSDIDAFARFLQEGYVAAH